MAPKAGSTILRVAGRIWSIVQMEPVELAAGRFKEVSIGGTLHPIAIRLNFGMALQAPVPEA